MRAANSWRVLFWVRPSIWLLAFADQEMALLRKVFVALVGLTGLLTVYIFVTGDIGLYARLSARRFSDPGGVGLTWLPVKE